MRRFLNKYASRLLQKHAFCPKRRALFFNPFWLCRRALYQALEQHAKNIRGRVLDFGCGSAPYRELFPAASSYTGLEYDTPDNRQHKRADIFYDGETIPLPDEDVDCILSTQTIEHVPNPEAIVAEWSRVLRPGGTLLLTVPFMWPEHEMPYDFQRYTTNGVRNLLERNDFIILSQERLLSDCRAPVQLFQAWLHDVLRMSSRSKVSALLLTCFFFAPLTLLGCGLAAVMPKNGNTYMDNFIFAQRKQS